MKISPAPALPLTVAVTQKYPVVPIVIEVLGLNVTVPPDAVAVELKVVPIWLADPKVLADALNQSLKLVTSPVV